MKETYRNLLNMLKECIDSCLMCSVACLEEKDVKMMIPCIKLDTDCAQICTVAASMIPRGSENAGEFLKVCAQFCRKCAAECEKHSFDHCRKCAEACRKCEEACEAAVA